MKFRNSARNGLCISIIILIIAVILLIIPSSILRTPTNALDNSSTLKDIMSNVGNNQVKTPIWKTACYIIGGVLAVLSVIINFVMCRCHNCGHRIKYMDIFMMYCPYCSRSLESSRDK